MNATRAFVSLFEMEYVSKEACNTRRTHGAYLFLCKYFPTLHSSMSTSGCARVAEIDGYANELEHYFCASCGRKKHVLNYVVIISTGAAVRG